MHQAIRPSTTTASTDPAAAASVPWGVAYCAHISDQQARRTPASLLIRRQGMARIRPAATTEAITDRVAACQAAIAARGAQSGQGARGRHRERAIAIAAA